MTTVSIRSLLAAAALIGTVLAPLHLAEARKGGAAFGVTTGTNRQDPVVRVTRDHRGEQRLKQPSAYGRCAKISPTHRQHGCIVRDNRQ
jgi:hypothetical protein